ncbi:MAG: LysE family translocator [Paracoccaceae bacterium]|nr:LysE family translocator [Paracoccaceae bacterium]
MTLTLILFLFPLAYSPGPGNLYFAANGAKYGFRATIPATTGYHLATWIVTLFIGIGFGTVLNADPRIFVAIKYAGSAYILWLAWSVASSKATSDTKTASREGFVSGVLLMLLNPKAYLIIALMFSQFLQSQSWVELLWITSVFTANNLIAFSVWTVLGDGLGRAFQSEKAAKWLNAVLGGMLGFVAVWMFIGS